MNKVETMDKSMQQLNNSNAVMEATVLTLHEGQLMMDNNIKMLMIKMGIKTGPANITGNKHKENNRAASGSEANDKNWVTIDETDTHSTEGGADRGTYSTQGTLNTPREDEDMDGAEEFHGLTDDVFDDVLKQCERTNYTTVTPQKIQKTSDLLGLRPGGARSQQ